MKTQDNQHLDFLISQYVDGSLDPAGKKSVEQTLLTDPAARRLYAEHREVQDMLEDWGSRIPMIHWDEFDARLARRLERDAQDSRLVIALRRWLKPVAAAAALFVAGALGYVWHGWSIPIAQVGEDVVVQTPVEAPRNIVRIEDGFGALRPSLSTFSVDEPLAQAAADPVASVVLVSAPEEATAVQSLKESVAYGLGNLPQSMSLHARPAGPNTVVVVPILQPRDTRESYQPYP